MEKATCNTIQCDELLEAKAAVAENSLETTILASGRERRVTDAETFGSSCSANPQTSARVESYGLSPIQKGMLFHHLDARDSGVDVEQVICALDEALHKEAFGSAWQGVINRHAILRTCFRWQAGEAQQDVHDSATIELEEIDWLGVRSEEQDERWSRLLVTDRRRGFDLSVMPLMRLTLIALAPNRFRVLWTFHHILLDGRSFPIILREVFDAYSAIREGKRISLSEPKPYREYIDWLSQQDFARSEEYWREALRGFRTPVEISLPNTPEDPAEIRGAKDFRELRFSRALTDKLRAFAKKHQLTLNTLLQGAWALLLHHYSGEEDIVFGATRACRRSALEGADDRVGLFINTLPMRVCVSSDGMLADLFHALREQQTSMRDYEHTPLSQVQRWSEVPRGRQLFESIIVFENYHLDTLLRAQGGEWLNRHFDYFGQTNYPLTVIAYADPEFLLRIEYDCRRFNDGSITRITSHLANLLEGLCGEGMQRVHDLALTTREEQEQLLEVPMNDSVNGASDTCLHRLFEAQVEKTPHAVAVVCQGKSLTYGELNREAEKIAYRLRRSGVGPEVLVGLCVERSLELVIGILGILKAGGAYLPLDPSYPKERLAFMLDDASVSVLLTQPHLTGCLPDHQAAVIHFDHDDETTCPEPLSAETELAGVNPDNLAYVIYTSGSTGKPKGVLITHRNVARLFPATAPWFGFDPSHVWTLFHSYAFDFSVWEMWGALLHGGRLVIVPHDVSRSPEEFAALIAREQVTVLNQTPSAFRQLLPYLAASIEPDALSLRYVIFGGEALDVKTLKPWFDRYGERTPRLVNMYGITETTVHVTYRPITRADLDGHVGSVIGSPIPDLGLYLLNSHRQPVPVGVAGEIYVGGAGVARGYLQRPELTAERFIVDPFSRDAQARLYRTGDRARRLPNGDLEYLGRIDQQVKIRGFRIELGEIESELSRHPAVKQTVVVAREDLPGDKRLVAYFVADRDLDLADLRAGLCAQLPAHMVPAAFVRMATLPLTSNGKIDRAALPKPDRGRCELGRRRAAPRSIEEEKLWQIWSGVLGIDDIGIEDNFFELGGDSILAIQVISKARQMGLQLAPKDLFQHPTIADLAAVPATSSPTKANEGVTVGRVDLTPIQRWFFEQNLAEMHHWNQAFLFETVQPLAADVLEDALNEVVRHHDVFRLGFTRCGTTWEQAYGDEQRPFSLLRIDLSMVAESEQENEIESSAAKLQGSLDLASGKLVRAAYFDLGEHRSPRLLWIVHHLIVDGVSWRILLEDLETAYVKFLAKQPVLLPARTSSYQTWAATLNKYAERPEAQDELNYWSRVLDGPTTELPCDSAADSMNLENRAETVTVRLSRAETRALLQQVPAAQHAEINDILLAALADCLKTWTRADSLLVDLEGHGRTEIAENIDVSRTVGWFTTIHPLRLDLCRGATLAERVKTTRDRLRAVPDKGLGFGILRYGIANPQARAALAALAQPEISFNYLGQFDQVVAGSSLFRFAKESCGPWHSPLAQRRYLLEILSLVANGCFEVRWIFNSNRHRRTTIEALAQGYLTALRSLISDRATVHPVEVVPADFPLALLDQPTLDRVARDYPNLEDVYPLSSMQKLFLSMDAVGSKLGLEQWHYQLCGRLNIDAFKCAWQRVIQRHPILRSAFLADGLSEPLQVVSRHVELSWDNLDWRTQPAEEQKLRWQSLLQSDRHRGFDLHRAPLLRLILIRTTDDIYDFLWTTHHMLIDGWSWPVLFSELAQFYEEACVGREAEIEPPCPYRNYIAWLGQCDAKKAEAFWRGELKGINAPTRIGLDGRRDELSSRADEFGDASIHLSSETTLALQTLGRCEHLTLNTLMQGAWALLLSRYSGQRDILFGAACSGRSAEITGIHAMVGPCVNDLPVRVQIVPRSTLGGWLRNFQARQFAASEFQYSSVIEVHGWSEVPMRQQLFESLLVFQNYATGSACQQLGPEIQIRMVAAPETTNYPLTLTIVPGNQLGVKILYRADRFSSVSIRSVVQDLQRLIEAMVRNPQRTTAEILADLPPLQHRGPEELAAATNIHTAVRMLSSAGPAPQTNSEKIVSAIWRGLFEVPQVNLDSNFFDLGGHSLLLVEMHKQLENSLGRRLPIVQLFQHATVRSLARYLTAESPRKTNLEEYRNRAQRQQRALPQRSRAGRKN